MGILSNSDIIIYSKEPREAIKKLEQLMMEISPSNIKSYRTIPYPSFETNDGYIYRALSDEWLFCGRRYFKAYVQKGTDKRILNQVIMPGLYSLDENIEPEIIFF